MASSICSDQSALIVTANVVFGIVILATSCVAFYRVIKFKDTEEYETRFASALHLFYFMCIIYAMNRIPDAFLACYYNDSSFKRICYGISLVSYNYHWWSFLLILFLRVINIFKDTSLQTSKCYNVISLCIIWSTPPLSIVIMVVFLTISTKIGFLLMALYLIILLLFSQMLACTFVYKLYVLNRRTKTDSKDNSLIELMTKYTLLAIISIIGTVSLLVILVLSSLAEQSSDLVLVNHISQMSDVFLDVICVSLSMKFSANWYRRLCSGIDSKCRLCCLSLNNRLSLERSTSGSDSLANSTTTPQVEMEI
eukprot:240664_1